MPFCPRCRFEYTSSAATCPDCGGELVDSLPEAPKAVESDFAQVELCVVLGEIHAKLLRNALALQGIPSRAESHWPFAGPYSVLSPSSPIGGGFDAPVRIMVNRGDLGRARIVYEDIERGGAHPSDEGPPHAAE
jgi:hypothetical protein